MPSLQLSGPDEPDLLATALDSLDDAILAPAPANEIVLPGGEIIDGNDVERIRDGFEWVARMKEAYQVVQSIEAQLRQAAGRLAIGPQKTQRIAGSNGTTLKVELPDDAWDNKALLAAWNDYPALRDKCLKISTVGVKLVEWKKLLSVSEAPDDLRAFIAAVKAACRPATAAPKVTVEQPARTIDVQPQREIEE